MNRSSIKRGSTPMRKVGKVGRRRLATSRKLTAEAKREGHDFCELAAVLRDWKIDSGPCVGGLSNAHSQKVIRRFDDKSLDYESARGCWRHHAYVLDLLPPEKQKAVVCEAIRRRAV